MPVTGPLDGTDDVESYFMGEPQESLDFLMEEGEDLEVLSLETIDGKTNALFAA